MNDNGALTGKTRLESLLHHDEISHSFSILAIFQSKDIALSLKEEVHTSRLKFSRDLEKNFLFDNTISFD